MRRALTSRPRVSALSSAANRLWVQDRYFQRAERIISPPRAAASARMPLPRFDAKPSAETLRPRTLLRIVTDPSRAPFSEAPRAAEKRVRFLATPSPRARSRSRFSARIPAKDQTEAAPRRTMAPPSMAPAEAPREGLAVKPPGRGAATRLPARSMPIASAKRGGARVTLTRPPAASSDPRPCVRPGRILFSSARSPSSVRDPDRSPESATLRIVRRPRVSPPRMRMPERPASCSSRSPSGISVSSSGAGSHSRESGAPSGSANASTGGAANASTGGAMIHEAERTPVATAA